MSEFYFWPFNKAHCFLGSFLASNFTFIRYGYQAMQEENYIASCRHSELTFIIKRIIKSNEVRYGAVVYFVHRSCFDNIIISTRSQITTTHALRAERVDFTACDRIRDGVKCMQWLAGCLSSVSARCQLRCSLGGGSFMSVRSCLLLACCTSSRLAYFMH